MRLLRGRADEEDRGAVERRSRAGALDWESQAAVSGVGIRVEAAG